MAKLKRDTTPSKNKTRLIASRLRVTVEAVFEVAVFSGEDLEDIGREIESWAKDSSTAINTNITKMEVIDG